MVVSTEEFGKISADYGRLEDAREFETRQTPCVSIDIVSKGSHAMKASLFEARFGVSFRLTDVI